jgi:hypothetical protein
MIAFSLGGAEHERVAVEVMSYERAATGNYHDDNWLNVMVTVSLGSFEGAFPATFLTEEFVAFRDALRILCDTLQGEAKFETLEGQLFLKLSGNGRGQIFLKGHALDRAGDGNRLEFEVELDQTHLSGALRDLETTIERFPVRAS